MIFDFTSILHAPDSSPFLFPEAITKMICCMYFSSPFLFHYLDIPKWYLELCVVLYTYINKSYSYY